MGTASKCGSGWHAEYRDTTNLVHFVYVAENAAHIRVDDGILADVAPTLLFLLDLPKPKE